MSSYLKSNKNITGVQLELHRVSMDYVATPVLSSLSFRVRAGEFMSIIGPSGCGKSTLLHLIAGLIAPTEGSIVLSGTSGQLAGKSGYMPQSSTLFPWRTVLQNITLGPEIQGLPRQVMIKKSLRLLREFELLKCADSYPSSLSGGMQQKVALLRTILFNTSFLLLDEPFGSLDGLTRFSLQLWLMRLRTRYKSTVLLVTHDISEAILLSDRILVMSDRPARIVADISVGYSGKRDRKWLRTKKALLLEEEIASYFFRSQEGETHEDR